MPEPTIGGIPMSVVYQLVDVVGDRDYLTLPRTTVQVEAQMLGCFKLYWWIDEHGLDGYTRLQETVLRIEREGNDD